MSILHVISVASLEALNNALSRYREQSHATVQGFSSALSSRIARLESLESHFVEKINRAKAALHSCEIARNSDPPQRRRSCSSEASALASAQAKYSRYKSIMSNVRQARSTYNASEGNYVNSSLNFISSSTVPKFTTLIRDMRIYLEDDVMGTIYAENDPNASARTAVGIGSNPGIIGFGVATETGMTAEIHGENNTSVADTEIGNNEDFTLRRPSEMMADNTLQNNDVTSNIPDSNENTAFGTDNNSISEATIVAGGGVMGLITAAAIVSYLLGEKGKDARGEFFQPMHTHIDNAFYKENGKRMSDLLLMPPSPEKDELIKKYNALCDKFENKAKESYNGIIQEWSKQMRGFSWEDDVYSKSGMNKQQFVAIVGEMTKNNQGELPLSSMSDDKNYYFYAQNSKEVYVVSKDGSQMSRFKMSNDYNYQDDLKRSVVIFSDELYPRNPREDMFAEIKEGNVYKINKNGSLSVFEADMDFSDTSGLLNKKWNIKGKALLINSDAPKMVFTKEIDGNYTPEFKWSRIELGGHAEGELGVDVNVELKHKQEVLQEISSTTSLKTTPSISQKFGNEVLSGSVEKSVDKTKYTGQYLAGYGSITTKDSQIVEVEGGVGKEIEITKEIKADAKAGAYAGNEGVGIKVSASVDSAPLKIGVGARIGIKDIGGHSDIGVHQGNELLSQFSPELERQIKKDFLNDSKSVDYYEMRPKPNLEINPIAQFKKDFLNESQPVGYCKKSMFSNPFNPTFEDNMMPYRYKPPTDIQAQLIASEIEESEQFYQARKLANDYVSQKEFVDMGTDLSENFKIERITPLSEKSK